MTDLPADNLVMLTLVKPQGELEVFLERRPMPVPKADELLVKILAAPINPSDLGLLFGSADMSTLRASNRSGLPALTADISPSGMRALKGRIGEALPVGVEGCGIVVKTGDSPEAQALAGGTVALLGGGMYAEYRCLPVHMAMPLPEGTDPADGASCFVNPMTSLAFTETMRMENHSAIVHTAAASNLGQMLVKICAKDGIPLINIVRSESQVGILRNIGARYIVNSGEDDFMERLTDAIAETGATLGFDATGGGPLSGQILAAMEAAAVRKMTTYSRYGSDRFKQVYVYGMLDEGPTEFSVRPAGLYWSLSGFLLTPFMAKAGIEVTRRMRQRVVNELTTTFQSHYSHEISLTEALDLDIARGYDAKRTGDKYLIRPHNRVARP